MWGVIEGKARWLAGDTPEQSVDDGVKCSRWRKMAMANSRLWAENFRIAHWVSLLFVVARSCHFFMIHWDVINGQYEASYVTDDGFFFIQHLLMGCGIFYITIAHTGSGLLGRESLTISCVVSYKKMLNSWNVHEKEHLVALQMLIIMCFQVFWM